MTTHPRTKNCKWIHVVLKLYLYVTSHGQWRGQFNGTYGLTIVGEVLYVADYRNYRVQKFTLQESISWSVW